MPILLAEALVLLSVVAILRRPRPHELVIGPEGFSFVGRTTIEKLADIGRRLPAGATEELNMLQTAQLVAEAALLRKESRGGHYRADYPRAKRTWKGRHIEL